MSQIPHTNITRLVVKNYRSLADIDIGLSPLTVFVGQNAVGKSNVIDVLRFVRDALVDGFERAIAVRGGYRSLRCWYADETEQIRIEIYFEGPQSSGHYGLAFGGSKDDCSITWEKLSLPHQADSGAGHALTGLGQQEEMLLEAFDGKLVHYPKQIGVMPMNHEHNPYHASRRYQKNPFLPQLARFSLQIQSVLLFLTSMNFYDISPYILRLPQAAKVAFPLLEDGSNLASTLHALKQSQEGRIAEALRVVIEGFDDYSINQVNGSLVTKLHYVTQNGQVTRRSSNLLSEADGTIRMLAILTALYQERYLSPLIIEEPEKALYPDALAVCSDVLQEAAFSYQVLITTLSPDLITELPLDSLRVVEKENDLTKIGPISNHQYEAIEDQLFSAGALMRIEGLETETGERGMI